MNARNVVIPALSMKEEPFEFFDVTAWIPSFSLSEESR